MIRVAGEGGADREVLSVEEGRPRRTQLCSLPLILGKAFFLGLARVLRALLKKWLYAWWGL